MDRPFRSYMLAILPEPDDAAELLGRVRSMRCWREWRVLLVVPHPHPLVVVELVERLAAAAAEFLVNDLLALQTAVSLLEAPPCFFARALLESLFSLVVASLGLVGHGAAGAEDK